MRGSVELGARSCTGDSGGRLCRTQGVRRSIASCRVCEVPWTTASWRIAGWRFRHSRRSFRRHPSRSSAGRSQSFGVRSSLVHHPLFAIQPAVACPVRSQRVPPAGMPTENCQRSREAHPTRRHAAWNAMAVPNAAKVAVGRPFAVSHLNRPGCRPQKNGPQAAGTLPCHHGGESRAAEGQVVVFKALSWKPAGRRRGATSVAWAPCSDVTAGCQTPCDQDTRIGRPFHQNGETAARGPSVRHAHQAAYGYPHSHSKQVQQEAVLTGGNSRAQPQRETTLRVVVSHGHRASQNYAKNSLFSRRTKNVSPAQRGRILPVSGLQPTSNGVLGAPWTGTRNNTSGSLGFQEPANAA